MKRLFLICLFASVLPVYASSGLNGFVAGRVTDKKTGYAVEEATVTITGLNKTTLTDGDGFFYFADIPVGNCTVSFTCNGCENLKRDEVIRSNSITTINASLNRSGSSSEPKLNTQPAKNIVLTQPITDEPVEKEPQVTDEAFNNQPTPIATQSLNATYPTIISDGYGQPAHIYRGTRYYPRTQLPKSIRDTHPKQVRNKP